MLISIDEKYIYNVMKAIKVKRLESPVNTSYYRSISALCRDLGIKEGNFRVWLSRNGKNPKEDSFYYKGYWFRPIEVK